MGSYTEMYLNVGLVRDTPWPVINLIRRMLAGTLWDGEGEYAELNARHTSRVPPSPLFRIRGWETCLRNRYAHTVGGCSFSHFQYNKVDQHWELALAVSTKNYNREFQLFVEWLLPWIEKGGHVGHLRGDGLRTTTAMYVCGKERKWLLVDCVGFREDQIENVLYREAPSVGN